VASGTALSQRYTARTLAPLTGLVVRRWGAGRSWRPAFAKGMFLPVEATPRGTHHREFGALAPAIAAASMPAAGQFDGRARWQAPRCLRCRQSYAALSVPPGHGRDNALRRSACDRASTGHVWITIRRRYGREPFRILSQPSQPTASVLVTGGGAARVSPGTAPPSGLLAQFIDECCAQPPTLVISPGLA
jgi:hypothetical protein